MRGVELDYITLGQPLSLNLTGRVVVANQQPVLSPK
jgi:hypothetical protein